MAGNPFFPERDTGAIGGAFDFLFGPSPTTRRENLANRASGLRGQFREKFITNFQQNQNFGKALMDTINQDPSILSDPNFDETIQSLRETVIPTPSAAAPGTALIDRNTGEQEIVPLREQQLIDDVLASKAAGDEERAQLLIAQLPRQGGRMTVNDYITLRAAGVNVDPPSAPEGVGEVTVEQARIAQFLANPRSTTRQQSNLSVNDYITLRAAGVNVDPPSAPEGVGEVTVEQARIAQFLANPRSTTRQQSNLNDLVLRGLGAKTGNPDVDNIDVATARAAAVIRVQSQSQNILGQLAPLLGDSTDQLGFGAGQIQQMFKQFDERQGRATEGGAAKKETKPPVAGAGASDPAKQTPAQVQADTLDPSKMTKEEALALSKEDAIAIIGRVDITTLDPEVAEALLDAAGAPKVQ